MFAIQLFLYVCDALPWTARTYDAASLSLVYLYPGTGRHIFDDPDAKQTLLAISF